MNKNIVNAQRQGWDLGVVERLGGGMVEGWAKMADGETVLNKRRILGRTKERAAFGSRAGCLPFGWCRWE